MKLMRTVVNKETNLTLTAKPPGTPRWLRFQPDTEEHTKKEEDPPAKDDDDQEEDPKEEGDDKDEAQH